MHDGDLQWRTRRGNVINRKLTSVTYWIGNIHTYLFIIFLVHYILLYIFTFDVLLYTCDKHRNFSSYTRGKCNNGSWAVATPRHHSIGKRQWKRKEARNIKFSVASHIQNLKYTG